MRLILQNEYGTFEAGGGAHAAARITDIAGTGLLSKEVSSISIAGQPGRTVTNVRDTERTITIAFEILGDVREIEKLYRCVYHPADIIFFLGDRRRKITGRCVNAADAEKIIYHRLNKLVLQFTCDDPYFHDDISIVQPLSTVINHFPNVNVGGDWFVQLPAVATTCITAAVIANSGDTIVYPVLHISNISSVSAQTPEHGLVITNNTTGRQIEIDCDVTAGDEITVDLPKRKIHSRMYGNITNCISDDTVLSDFYLAVGDNNIAVESISYSDMLAVTIEFDNNYAAVMI